MPEAANVTTGVTTTAVTGVALPVPHRLSALVAALGRWLRIDDLTLDAEGRLALGEEGEPTVEIGWDPVESELVLQCDAGPVPAGAPAALLMALLQAAHEEWLRSGTSVGVSAAAHGHLVLARRLIWRRLDEHSLCRAVDGFLLCVGDMRRLLGSEGVLPVAPPGSPFRHWA